MDYQARLTEILEKVRKGGVYDVMPEYERQSDYLDTDEAQEVITALFLESLSSRSWHTCYDHTECKRDCRGMIKNDALSEIRSKWQTNQEDGE